MEKILQLIAQELQIKLEQVQSTAQLLDEGNTVPFIARYRKERTGSLDEEQIRSLEERLGYLRNLEQRRQDILQFISEQGKLTPTLEQSLQAATKMQTLEDLYLPYRPKRRTKAQIAREQGLEPLSQLIEGQGPLQSSPAKLAAPYLSSELTTVEEVWQGACHIVAENIADRAEIRRLVRQELWQQGVLTASLLVAGKDAPEFIDYQEYAEPVRQLPPHRILALNRGEAHKVLKLALLAPEETIIRQLSQLLQLHASAPLYSYYLQALKDSYKRLLFPSLERELRREFTEKAEKQAIHVFAANLRQLLLTRPISGHRILGLDPGYRNGCKTAIIDASGRILATDIWYLTGSPQQKQQAEQRAVQLIRQHGVSLIAIGNGTASYETEQFTAQLLEKYQLQAAYLIVSEAGASVYSASKLAREEMPDLDVSLRGAVSIARRVQDPLAELVKIDPQAIGVGQYQHDVNQKELAQSLGNVVESCVNHVGVELNTASPALLNYVAGISPTVAKNIIAYRDEHGSFTSRRELLKISRLGPAAFTQCAGFLRISQAINPLDNTSVHPESYPLAEKIIQALGFQLKSCHDPAFLRAAAQAQPRQLAAQLKAGLPTVTDILEALARPGRDPREDAPAPLTRRQITKLSDLQVGSTLQGRVQNVVDFGVFVDIGLKTAGFIHISELSSSFVRHPLDVVAVGDVVEAEIINIDEARNRIGLSIKRLRAQTK